MADVSQRKEIFLRWSLWILPFILPLYVIRFRIWIFPTTLLEIYFLLLVLLFFWTRGWGGFVRGWQRLQAWQKSMIAWLVITLISVFISPSFMSGLGLWRAYVLEPLIIFVVCAEVLRSASDMKRLRQSIFLVVPILCAYAIIQFVTGWGIPHPWNVPISEGRRATGPFPFPNALALFVTPIAAWAFAIWLHGYKLPATSYQLAGAAWVTGLISILLASSQGGLVAFVVTVLVSLLLHRPTRRFTIWASAIFIVLVLAVAPIRNRLTQVLFFQDWSGQVRLFIWRETWQMLKAHPILGAGFGGYPVVFQPYHKATAIEIFQYPHTILFNFWSETGLLGVAVFVWIVVTWVRRMRNDELRMMNFAPIAAILIHGLVDVPYFKNDLAILFWLFIFLTAIPSVVSQPELTGRKSSDILAAT